jgi:hypothetical protein
MKSTKNKQPKRLESPTTVGTSNYGKWTNRLVIGTPTLGTMRMEWIQARFGQTIPTNFSLVDVHQYMTSYAPIGFQIADAENLTAKVVVEGNFEWFCLHGDTLVETSEGEKPIRNIEIGEFVKTHTGNFKKVTDKHITPIKQRDPINWIKTQNHTIKATPNHPFMVKIGDSTGFINAEKVVEGDVLLYPVDTSKDVLEFNIKYNTQGNGYNGLVGGSRDTKEIGTVNVDKDVARFLGLFLAEGHVNKDGIAFTFNNLEVEFIDFIKTMSRSLFERDAYSHTTWATQVRISIRALSSLFSEWFVGGAREKRIPDFVFGWNLKNRLAFLNGYLDGDACDSCGGRTFSTVSELLSDDLVRLINGCGLRVSSVACRENLGGIVKHGQSAGQRIEGIGYIYVARISTDSMRKMHDLMDHDINGEYIEIPVLANEKHFWAASLKDNNVYNLTVEDDHSYIAGSVITHNCSWEDDNLPPLNALVKLNEYIIKNDTPIISGLYFTKSVPPEPILYRGMGKGYYADWKLGDKVWVDGVPFGFNLIHGSIIKALWKESPEYVVNGTVTRRVFDAPSESYIDPLTGGWMNQAGTSDLAWCARIMKEDIFTKAGWPEYQKKQFPFLVDTSIFVKHIDRTTGMQYPMALPKAFMDGKITFQEALRIMTA